MNLEDAVSSAKGNFWRGLTAEGIQSEAFPEAGE